MPDKPEHQQIPDVNGSETSTTQRLLKKDAARGDSDSATTAPLTGRLADLTKDTPESKKSNTWLFVMIGAAVAVVVLVLVFMFFFTGESILSSGSSDINASGSDSMNATIVEGQPVPQTRETARNTSAQTERRSRGNDSAEEEPDPEPTRAQNRPVSQPETPAVRENRSQPSNPKPAESTQTAESRPEPSSSAPAKTPETKPASSPSGSSSESDSGARAAKPAATPPASIQQGFDLKSQAEKSVVKTGDLVPLTGDVIRPVLEKDVTPDKPAIAKRLRRSGRVILRILIDENGNVIDAKVVNENPTNLGFGDAATDAAMKRKYTPATKDNVRVKVWETLVFTFR
jgi:protein TonB